MTLKITKGGGAGDLGGAGAVLDVRHAAILGGNLGIGVNTGWSQATLVRYGGDAVTLGGVNGFDNGSAGLTPNRGYGHSSGMNWKRARETGGATNIPIDWYSGFCPAPTLTRPPAPIPSAFSVWEVGCIMALENLPTGAITRDCGLVFLMNLNTTFPSALRQTPAAGSNFSGFGVVYDGTDGRLAWICRKDPAALPNETVQLTGPGTAFPTIVGAARPVTVRVRFHSATVGAEARLEVFLDGILMLTRNWGPATTLPVPADMAAIQQQQGYYRPMWRTALPSANICPFLFRDEYVRAASTVALLGPVG
jgi:hypothetical protein